MSISRRPLPRLAGTMLACACLALFAAAAGAQTWAEVGDAGDVPATVQVPVGLYALNQITGTLSSPEDVDLYCIELLNPTVFSANLLCASHADPSIWIFRFTGQPVAHNDVCAFANKTIPVGMFSIGTYYVAVGSQNRQPLAGVDPIWISGLFTGPRVPDGPGAAGNLTGWTGAGGFASGSYTLNFQGASYCGTAVPTEEQSWGAMKAIYR